MVTPTAGPALIQNGVRILDGDVYLLSRSVVDAQSHTWPDGKTLTIAGGIGPEGFAQRNGVNLAVMDRYEELSLTTDHPFDHIAERMVWEDEAGQLRLVRDLSIARLQQLDGSLEILSYRPLPKVVAHWLRVKTSAASTPTS